MTQFVRAAEERRPIDDAAEYGPFTQWLNTVYLIAIDGNDHQVRGRELVIRENEINQYDEK